MLPSNLYSCSKTAPACFAEASVEINSGRNLSSRFRFAADCKASFISVKACSCSSNQVIFRFFSFV